MDCHEIVLECDVYQGRHSPWNSERFLETDWAGSRLENQDRLVDRRMNRLRQSTRLQSDLLRRCPARAVEEALIPILIEVPR